jgi:hypothetical protein
MLDDFIISNRDSIIARAHARVASRTGRKGSDVGLTSGVPVFLDQLGAALRLTKSGDVIGREQLRNSAGEYGHDLRRMGLSIAQVVRGYGDICQTITELAIEQDAQIPVVEFQTLNLCLDEAIAEAVTEYARQH